jgi:hypothetical protein
VALAMTSVWKSVIATARLRKTDRDAGASGSFRPCWRLQKELERIPTSRKTTIPCKRIGKDMFLRRAAISSWECSTTRLSFWKRSRQGIRTATR